MANGKWLKDFGPVAHAVITIRRAADRTFAGGHRLMYVTAHPVRT